MREQILEQITIIGNAADDISLWLNDPAHPSHSIDERIVSWADLREWIRQMKNRLETLDQLTPPF